jgi:hypothetical protein
MKENCFIKELNNIIDCKMILLIYFSRIIPINKRLAPNLRRLLIGWNRCINSVKSINQLFDRDVLFSLTKFTLSAKMAGPHVLNDLLSMLSPQCLYSFDIEWSVSSALSLSETSKILSDTFQQLKGSVPIELELCLEINCIPPMYSIRVITLPRMDRYLSIYLYLNKNNVQGYK